MSTYERQRLYALRQLNILDTPPSEGFDRITRMAAKLFELPVAAVSLTDKDRQWFKSRFGTEVTEVPRTRSPCSDISASSEVIVIEDMLASDQYRDSPQAKLGMRFYAGAPLTTREGYTLGTLCVLGPEPRAASEEELNHLVDLSAMVMAQIELQHALGRVDPVTLLPNRNQLAEDLEDLSQDQPQVEHHAVYVELGNPQQLSSMTRVMGSQQIDQLARDGGYELQRKLGPDRRVYSVGACHYLFLSKAPTLQHAHDEAYEVSQRLRRVARWRNLAIIRPVAGIASFRPARTRADEVIRLALSACESARQKEISVGAYTPSLDLKQQRHFRLLRDMQRALESGSTELSLVFQPRISLNSGACSGAEALLRWAHPELGDIPPGEFIPLIENSPLAKPLTSWVLDAAIAQAAEWRREGIALRVSANVMACNFEEKGFTNDLIERLNRFELPPQAFELELTESALMSNRRLVRRQLRRLSRRGIKLAIDDFGTGYSSLAYLVNMPADVLKIDRVFTASSRSGTREQQSTLLKALIEVAHTMGFRTVAEGFEPPSMAQTLQQLGCDEGQSFSISRPLTPKDFKVWYGNRTGTTG